MPKVGECGVVVVFRRCSWSLLSVPPSEGVPGSEPGLVSRGECDVVSNLGTTCE